MPRNLDTAVQDTFDLHPNPSTGQISAPLLGNDQIYCGNVQFQSTYYTAKPIVENDRARLRELLVRQEGVSAPCTEFGTTVILRLARDNVDNFLTWLRTRTRDLSRAGHFFDLPNHFHVGMGLDTEMFREGLHRIRQALAIVLKE